MNTKIMWVGLGLVVLIGVVMAVTLLLPGTEKFRGTLYDPALPAPGIELTKADGSSFKLSEQQGEVVLLFFGYTSCPDVCPTTLSELRKITTELGEDASRVQVVYITVDPDRDTPQKVQEYASLFSPSFIGLSGSLEELEPIWKEYGVFREIEKTADSENGYLVTHTARVYLIDQKGDLLLSYSFGTPTDDILHDVKLALQ